MPEPAEGPPQPPRTWRPMALWTAGILLALGLAWFVGAVAGPVWEVRKVLRHYPGEAGSELCPLKASQVAADIARLGGARTAAERIRLYLRMPGALVDKRHVAVLMLPFCESEVAAAVPLLEALTRDADEPVRRAAQEALERIRCLEARNRLLGRVEELLREAGYWRGYPLQSVRRDAKRRQWEFAFSDGRPDGGYAAYIADEAPERIDILLFPPLWTKYERRKPPGK